MNHHDKHQYHFEKYLRNEMPEDERVVFDEKLAADASLRMAFEYYKLNRQQLLKQLIEDHRITRRDNRFNKLIFLLISLTGIALAFNYYLYKDNDQKIPTGAQRKNVFVRYIPFLNWEKQPDKNSAVKSKEPTTDSAYTPENQTPIQAKDETVETLEPSVKDDERSITDVFLKDTFIVINDKNTVEQLIRLKQLSTDSVHNDSISSLVIVKPKVKNSQLFVEFWQSPVNYSGYFLTDKKLILYGIDFPFEVYLYKEGNELHAILPKGNIILTQQLNFQKF